MSDRLKPGDKVRTMDGGVVTVKPFRTPDGREKEFIGDGGQGTVYLVDYLGKDMALKWYKQSMLNDLANSQQFYDNIQRNVNAGSPSKTFLWPEAITEWKNGTFGYVMDLRPKGYSELSEFLVKPSIHYYQVIVDAALQIVSAFRILHNRGCSYLDMNDGNFFINPKTGSVKICDNDNVAPENTYVIVNGKPTYMAPEIVMGTSKPNTLTDRYSMALILYMLFCVNHPLEGKRYWTPGLTPELTKRLFGSDALFMMDPNDKSNGPHPVINKASIIMWENLPDYMREIFERAFSQRALKTPAARPKEKDWLNVLTRFRSEIVPCACGNEIFTKGGLATVCERCGRPAAVTHSLELHGYRIPAVKNSRIYRCQLGVCDDTEALNPVAQVVQGVDSGALYLQNLSGRTWSATDSAGGRHKVAPNEKIRLLGGTRFSVDDATVTVWKNKTT